MLLEPMLRISECAQLGVPLGLERVGDHAVLGVDLHVATPGDLGVIAGMLDFLATCSIGIAGSRLEFALYGERALERDGRDDLHQQLADRVVETAATDALADRFGALDPATLADVVGHEPLAYEVIANGHSLTAYGADCQSLQQCRAFARRSTLAIGAERARVITQPAKVVLELVPGDVVVVGIGQERVPLVTRHVLDQRTTVGAHATSSSAEAVGTGVARMLQNPQHTRVRELAPEDLAIVRIAIDVAGELPFLLAEPLGGRGGGAGALEGAEQHANGALDACVGIEPDALVRIVDESDRQPHPELAALGLVEDPAAQPRAQYVELGFTHRALEAEQQAVVEVRRVVHAVLIEDQRARQRADFE